MQWIDKDQLGWAIWRFWLCILCAIGAFSVLTGFLALAIEGERNAGKRATAFYTKGGLEVPESLIQDPAPAVSGQPVIVEAATRTLQLIGWPCLAIIIIVSLNLWLLKRETPAFDPSEWEDPKAKARTVK